MIESLEAYITHFVQDAAVAFIKFELKIFSISQVNFSFNQECQFYLTFSSSVRADDRSVVRLGVWGPVEGRIPMAEATAFVEDRRGGGRDRGQHSSSRSWIPAKTDASSLLHGKLPLTTNRCICTINSNTHNHNHNHNPQKKVQSATLLHSTVILSSKPSTSFKDNGNVSYQT